MPYADAEYLPEQDGVGFGRIASIQADEQQAQPERECEDDADLGVAIGGAATKGGYREAAGGRTQKKTNNWCNGRKSGPRQQHRPCRPSETHLGEGVRRKRRTAQHYKVTRDAGDDRDHGPGLKGMLHELETQHLLQVAQ